MRRNIQEGKMEREKAEREKADIEKANREMADREEDEETARGEEEKKEKNGQEEEQEKLFAAIYEGNVDLPQAVKSGVKEISCLSCHEEQQVYLLKEENGRKSILKRSRGSRTDLLEKEAENLRNFPFSFLPEVYGYFHEEDDTFLWKEYIAGDTLYEMVERNGPLDTETAGKIIIRLCEMTGQLHNFVPPLIHRDLKPQNIVITPEENLFFIDLETAREYREEAEFDTVFVGTRRTAAPEQYGFRQTDCRTDIYALGVVCLYLLTGSMDVQKDSVMERLTPPFRQIVKTCTRLDPRERYQTCGELKAAVTVALSGDIPGAAGRKGRKKRITRVIFTAAAALCLFAGWRIWQAYSWENGEYHFSSELIEQAVRMELNREEGAISGADLELVMSLRICGNEVFGEGAGHSSYGGYHNIDGTEVTSYGNIRSLEDCSHMKNLQTLILDRQKITDLSPLEGLPLTTVSLCRNPITDLTPLAHCEKLRELYLDEVPLEDLAGVEELHELKLLDISNSRVTDVSSLKGLELEALYALNLQLKDPEALEELPLKVLRVCSSQGMEEAAGRITTLEDLDISGYCASGLDPLFGLENLTMLRLTGDIENIEGIGRFPMLRRLDLEETPVSSLMPLGECGELEVLSVYDSQVMKFDVLTDLEKLNLLVCDSLQEPAVYKAVPEPWFQLEVLERTPDL